MNDPSLDEQSRARARAAPLRSTEAGCSAGEVVFIYAFDVAYDMHTDDLTELLDCPVREYVMEPGKRTPKEHFFYRPKMVSLAGWTVEGYPEPLDVTVKVFNIGAISLQFTLPLRDSALAAMVPFHALGDNGAVYQAAHALAQQVRDKLHPYCVNPVSELGPSEAYTVFCLDPDVLLGPDETATAWLRAQQRAVAALLTEEIDRDLLSDQEVIETTENCVSYYRNDLAVIDWDAALVVGDVQERADLLHIIELANVQLLELGVYDRLLDTAVDRAYRDMATSTRRRRSRVQSDLREIRIDMARMSDEVLHITKFFGDWHLARVYQMLSERFHLADWHRWTGDKLRTLADLYQLLQSDRTNQVMISLETIIVLLFVIDLVVLVWVGG